MWRALLAKDLRRAWRNPIPWLINLALPLCITVLIGLLFGGSSENGLSRIHFALVDEDNSVLTGMLRGALNNQEGAKHLEPVFVERAEALRQLNQGALSAVLIIPTNFTRHYIRGDAPVQLELVKNPAESIAPTVMEELLGVVVTGLNGLARNFQDQFPAWEAVLDNKFEFRKVSGLLESTGHKIEAARQFLNPPLVSYEKSEPSEGEPAPASGAGQSNLQARAESAAAAPQPPAPAKSKAARPAKSGQSAAIFAYLLPGLSAMFLLFVAGNAMSDLLRELRFRTFERYQTLRERLMPFVVCKLLFVVLLLLLCSAVLLGGGGLLFGITWQHPVALTALAGAYACFATGLMAVIIALMPDERRAGALVNMSGMILGIAGGCMFPRQQLPRFLGEHLTPLLPSAWFIEAVRALQFGGSLSWWLVLVKLLVVSALLVAGAVWLFGRRFQKGVQP